MPCLDSDGRLTAVAERVLGAAASRGGSLDADAVASAADVPLYRARASLRELASAGLVLAEGSGYRIAPAGERLLRAAAAAPRTG